MRLPRQVFGVPMHPLLVHFPITLWLAAPALDLAALTAGPEPWWTLAVWTTFLGVVIGRAGLYGLNQEKLALLRPLRGGIADRLNLSQP